MIAVLVLAIVAVAALLLITTGKDRAVASATTADIAVLDSATTAPRATSTLDADLVAQIKTAAENPNAPLGLKLDAGRQALLSDDGVKVIAAPGDGGDVCVMPVTPNTDKLRSVAAPTCVDAIEFNEQGVSTTLGSAPNVTVAGLVPDGVKEITLTLADGTSQTTTVTNNAFAFSATTATRALSFDGPNGRVEIAAASLDS